ncbi:hypothetical protein B7486_49600 [cyanobacterium TDX16]|nr:hypothetical protein B7486_49600 [cyanobacterium TDX16]
MLLHSLSKTIEKLSCLTLNKAILNEADLSKAELAEVQLHGVQIDNANFNRTIMPKLTEKNPTNTSD